MVISAHLLNKVVCLKELLVTNNVSMCNNFNGKLTGIKLTCRKVFGSKMVTKSKSKCLRFRKRSTSRVSPESPTICGGNKGINQSSKR